MIVSVELEEGLLMYSISGANEFQDRFNNCISVPFGLHDEKYHSIWAVWNFVPVFHSQLGVFKEQKNPPFFKASTNQPINHNTE